MDGSDSGCWELEVFLPLEHEIAFPVNPAVPCQVLHLLSSPWSSKAIPKLLSCTAGMAQTIPLPVLSLSDI